MELGAGFHSLAGIAFSLITASRGLVSSAFEKDLVLRFAYLGWLSETASPGGLSAGRAGPASAASLGVEEA